VLSTVTYLVFNLRGGIPSLCTIDDGSDRFMDYHLLTHPTNYFSLNNFFGLPKSRTFPKEVSSPKCTHKSFPSYVVLPHRVTRQIVSYYHSVKTDHH
jgi:hypothetical protein